MKTIKNKVIIDFEFNGLPRHNFEPEISQVKAFCLETGIKICANYRTRKAPQIGALLKTGKITGKKLFNKREFNLLLKEIGVDDPYKAEFIGFSNKTDKSILSQYGIGLNWSEDLQETLTRSKYEKNMAINGRSMETCYYIVFEKEIAPSHGDIEELDALIEIYEATRKLRLKKYLTVYPWGDEAGMPLKEYCDYNRRRADGYRYNNNDILAISLDHTIDLLEDLW